MDSYNSPCIGDFNAIMLSSEKEGGLSLPEQEFKEFKDLINYYGLIDMGYSGLTYTWSN